MKIAEQMRTMATRASEMVAPLSPSLPSSSSDSGVSDVTGSESESPAAVETSPVKREVLDEFVSVRDTEGEVNFLPELFELMQLNGQMQPNEVELKLGVERFKKASEHYKKQVGIAVAKKESEEAADGDVFSASVKAPHGFTKTAQKRKRDNVEETTAKSPLLHLEGDSVDETPWKKQVTEISESLISGETHTLTSEVKVKEEKKDDGYEHMATCANQDEVTEMATTTRKVCAVKDSSCFSVLSHHTRNHFPLSSTVSKPTCLQKLKRCSVQCGDKM